MNNNNPVSFGSYFLIALQEFIKEQLPQIQWIDEDLAQDTTESAPTILFPALLIDFSDTNFSEISSPGLFATTSIRMRLIDNPISQAYADAPLEVRQDALRFYDLEQKLITALHGWTPNEDIIQPLSITSSQGKPAPSALRCRTLTFTTAYESE